jgi:hypothetical protein
MPLKKYNYQYKYEHTNGKIITKPAIVVESGTTPEEYFDSPFVKRWWKEEIKETSNAAPQS